MSTKDIILSGGKPWGFRINGGSDCKHPVRISRVNPGSKAAENNIREGDIISRINGELTNDLTNVEVHTLIRKAGDTLNLRLNELKRSPTRFPRRRFKEEHLTRGIKEEPSSSSTGGHHNHRRSDNLESSELLTENQINENSVTTSTTTTVTTTSTSSSSKSFSENISVNNDSIKTEDDRNITINSTETSENSKKFINKKDHETSSIKCDKSDNNTNNNLNKMNCELSGDKLNENKPIVEGQKVTLIVKTVCLDPNELNTNVLSSTNSNLNQGQNKLITSEFDKNLKTVVNDKKIEINSKIELKQKTVIKELITENYRVESPQLIRKLDDKKNGSIKKSRSLDDNDVTIQEISDSSSAADLTDNQPIVCEVDSEVESECTEGGIVSPLQDEFFDLTYEETSAMTEEEEIRLRGFLNSLNIDNSSTSPDIDDNQSNESSTSKQEANDLKTRRAKNRAALESHFFPQRLNPRYLDIIKEENSDSNSEFDRKSDTNERLEKFDDDLDDDVFLDALVTTKKTNAVFPKSNLDFSVKKKHTSALKPPSSGIIREEPQCVLLDTKIIETSAVDEGCSTWKTKTIESKLGAEIVYLDSGSSSVSSVTDLDEPDRSQDSEDVRIQTPTIGDDDMTFYDAPTYTSDTEEREKTPSNDPPPKNISNNDNNNNVKEFTNETEVNYVNNNNNNSKNDNRNISENVEEIPNLDINSLCLNNNNNNNNDNNNTNNNNNNDTINNNIDNQTDNDNDNNNNCNNNNKISSDFSVDKIIVNSLEIIKNQSINVNESVKENSSVIITPNFHVGEPCTNLMFTSSNLNISNININNNNNNNNNNVDVNVDTNNKIQNICTDNEISVSGLNKKLLLSVHDNNNDDDSCNKEFNRQDSSGSVCSSSHSHSTSNSQCTARYLASSQSDIGELEYGQCVSGRSSMGPANLRSLRQLCVEQLASMPFGNVILEELANVSESISNLTGDHQIKKPISDMPYPLPELPRIDKIIIPTVNKELPPPPPPQSSFVNDQNINVSETFVTYPDKLRSPPPPPVPVSPSQLRLPPPPPVPAVPIQLRTPPPPPPTVPVSPTKLRSPPPPPVPAPPNLEAWMGVPTEQDPKVLVCLSPSQRNYINENRRAAEISADSLLDMHKKIIERRGYHEYSDAEINSINREKNERETLIRENKTGAKDNTNRLLAIIRNTEQSTSENSQNKITSENRRDTTSVKNGETMSSKSYNNNNNQPNIKQNDTINNRFSNFETLINNNSIDKNNNNFNKRFSNIETSTYETKKHIENGNVVFEFTDTKKNKLTNVDGKNIVQEIESESKTNDNRIKKSEKNPNYENVERNIKNNFTIKKNENKKDENEKENEMKQQQHKMFEEKIKSTTANAKSDLFDTDKFTFREFDFVPKIFNDDFFNIKNKLINEKSKSHDVFDFSTIQRKTNNDKNNNNTNVVSEEIKKESRKFETNTMPLQRQMSLNDQLRLNSQNLTDWMKHARQNSESSENILKPLSKEENLCKGVRSNVEIRAPRLTSSTNNLSEINEEINRQYDLTIGRRNKILQTRQSMIDQTPITRHVSTDTRRMSLPKEVQEQQLNYIRQKERELQTEFERLEQERKNLEQEMNSWTNIKMDSDEFFNIRTSHPNFMKNDNWNMFGSTQKLTDGEVFRKQMHDEWLNKVAEREERRLQKIIKVTNFTDDETANSMKKQMIKDLGDEFINKVKERRSKLSMPSDSDWESGAESQPTQSDIKLEENHKVIDHKITIVDGEKAANPKSLPKHLKEFLEFSQTNQSKEEMMSEMFKEDTQINKQMSSKQDGVWSPNSRSTETLKQELRTETNRGPPEPPPPPVWTPRSAGPSPTLSRKEFRPVNFESPTFQRKNLPRQNSDSSPPPWNNSGLRRTISSQSASNISNNSFVSNNNNNNSFVGNLPKSQNPTITLLQKAREGQLPKGPSSYSSDTERPQFRQEKLPAFMRPNEIVHTIRRDYMSESETDIERPKRMAETAPRIIEGIGPTTKDGMPIVLRSEVPENNQSKWYKKMYNTLHKNKDDDEYVTVRYKTRRGRYPYKSNGYMSEPEPHYDSDYTIKYNTLDRRRIPSTGSYQYEERSYGTMPNPVKSSPPLYKNQPGRIENYMTGHSSISDKETKKWWDEVMEIFDGHLEQQKHVPNVHTQGYMSRALKEHGYESDSSLVFRKREENNLPPLSPVEQKQYYRDMQAGGEPPLQGFRKPAPEKPKDDTEIEYFHITPTLTKIRVHNKNIVPQPQREIICYPITSVTKPIDLFGSYSTVKSFVPISPPPPPSRKSSKRNTTLKLFTGTHSQNQSISPGRHDACFSTTNQYFEKNMNASGNTANRIVKRSDTMESIRSKSAGPVMIAGMSTSLKEEKNIENTTRIARRQFYRVNSSSPISRGQRFEMRKSSPSPVAFGRGISRERTFAEEKKRLEQARKDITAPTRILRNPDLKSPDEVKKALQTTFRLPSRERNSCIRSTRRLTGNSFKSSTSLYSSNRSIEKAGNNEKALRVTVAISSRGKELVRATADTPKYKPSAKAPSPIVIKSNISRSTKSVDKSKSNINTKSCMTSSNLSLARTSSTYSIDSINSKKKTSSSRPLTIVRSASKEVTSPVTITSKTRRKKTTSKDKNGDEKKKSDKRLKEEKMISEKEMIRTSIQNGMKNSDEFIEKEVMHSMNETLMSHKDNVRSDTFFQNLFLRNLPSPTPSTSSSYYQNNSSVMEKAHMWNSLTYKSEPSLRQQNVYLSQKKPVSGSKFIKMEQERTRLSRSVSPERIFRPSRVISDHISKFDSLYQLSDEEDEFGNISRSLTYSYHERSRSEPPSKTVLTEMSRPHSPITIHGRNSMDYSSYRCESPTRSIRSPSCRRIQSFKASQNEEMICKKVNRARSLGSSDRRLTLSECKDHSRSSSSLNYEKHIPVCSHRKQERFKELNDFYSDLERVGQLERTTSSSDIRPIRGDEEVIDFELWQKIRAHERAEKELNYLVRKLKDEQKEKDLLFRPHDAEDLRWDKERDSGLRIKEKSVEDLREIFHKKSEETELDEARQREQDIAKDTYKPFWRGSSVLNLASNMVDKFNPPEKGDKPKPKKEIKYKTKEEKKLGFSNKLISTLSKDQINKIKHQLSEIYSNGPIPGQKSEKYDEVSEKYVITVPSTSKERSGLTVRSNSLLSREELLQPILQKHHSRVMEKADSIGTITESKVSSTMSKQEKAEKNQLSEVDKRKISQSLSREIKDKLLQRRDKSEIHPKETRGAHAAENAKLSLHETLSPRTRYSLEISDETFSLAKNERDSKADMYYSLPRPSRRKQEIKQKEHWSQEKTTEVIEKRRPVSLCETESMSSEASNRTVIFKSTGEDVQSKIKYFEEKKEEESKGSIIYHAREDSSPDEEEVMKIIEEKVKARQIDTSCKADEHRSRSPGMTSAHSVTDLKDLFGEKSDHYSQSLNIKSHSVPPPENRRADIIVHVPAQSMSLSEGSSFESITRSRSVSPEGEKYNRSYLNIVKTGDVRKIKDKFESLDVNVANSWIETSTPRRFCSDPELDKSFFEKRGTSPNKTIIKDHEAGDVSRITHKFELRNSSSRGRSRTRRDRAISPISKIHFKKDDRFMPHIDIISKTASLRHEIPKSTSSNRHSHTGSTEVEKIKSKFESDENMSILGQMYTSAPDFRELKDISSYLSGSWVAHQFPRPQDNARSLSSPQKKLDNEKIKRRITRPSSTSPPRMKSLATSILKPYYDIFADQKFDPSIHRPKYRYVPGKELEAEAIWKKLQNNMNKPSVKFEEPTVVPPPPPIKGVPLNYINQSPESPRRYVEGDVNIHYRTPIRYEYKDAIPEDELAHRQAESMRRLYQEERRRKYIQELQDMNNRRHTDNFTPSQKSPVNLNRYDSFPADLSPKSPVQQQQQFQRIAAKALYNFQGQTARELTFRKGDIIYVRRQIDKNWYEGEHNAMIGLFPSNYVDIVSKDLGRQLQKKPSEGQARAKYNFNAQSAIELSLNKGELVTLTRRVDDNWFEGRIANRKGIFPVAYVDVLMDIGTDIKPIGSPAAHSLIISPTIEFNETRQNYPTNNNTISQHHHQHQTITNGGGGGSGMSRIPNGGNIVRESKSSQKTEVLHVDTNSEPMAYRALYKYRPQNTDELELNEGDIIFVLEKCDDGWFVGTSQRTGNFGTFPGNYVEKS